MNATLSSLLVSEDEIAREAMINCLQGLMEIGKVSGNPIPTAAFERLDRTTKMLTFLVALKAAAMLGVGHRAGATAEELAAIVGSDVKSVREYASRLKRKFLTRGPTGYEVPIERIRAVTAEIATRRNE